MKITHTTVNDRLRLLVSTDNKEEFFYMGRESIMFRYMENELPRYTNVTSYKHMQELGKFTDKEMTVIMLQSITVTFRSTRPYCI